MTRTDRITRLTLDQTTELFTATVFGRHFAIGVDATDPTCESGLATLLEGDGGLWHACGDGFDAAGLADVAGVVQAAKVMLGQCGKPQGSHKGDHGYVFRSAAATIPEIAPMSHATLAATFPHVVEGRRFAMVLGARSPEDRHALLCLLVDQAGLLRPLARFDSEWIDDLVDTTARISSGHPVGL
jgi:hypothetical protein